MNKIIIFLFCGILMLSLVSATCHQADVDLSGSVDDNDVAAVVNNWNLHAKKCSEANNWCNKTDINRNSRVNLRDIARVKKFVGCSYSPPSEECKNADLNNDGVVNLRDYVQARRDALTIKKLNGCDLSNPSCQSADINSDGRVNLIDFAKAMSIAQDIKSLNGCM